MTYLLAAFAFIVGVLFERTMLTAIPFAKAGALLSANPETTAITVTGALAFVGAIWGVMSQRAITRRQVTLEFLSKEESDKELAEARSSFIELAKSSTGLAQFAAQDKESTPETLKIRMVLNNFELIAISIQRGIIDYEIYRRWYQSTVIRYWVYAVPFVLSLRSRTNNQLLFNEFETMAGWFSGRQRPRRGYRLGQWL